MSVLINKNAPNFRHKRKQWMIIPLIAAIGLIGISFMILSSAPAPQKSKEGIVSFDNDIPNPKVGELADSKTKAIEATAPAGPNYQLDEFDFSALSRKDSVVSVNRDEYNADKENISKEKELALRKTDSIYNLMLGDISAERNSGSGTRDETESRTKKSYIQEADNLEKELLGDENLPIAQEKPKKEQQGEKRGGFNSMSFSSSNENDGRNAITPGNDKLSLPAVILNDVVVKNGSSVLLRILDSKKINGYTLKRNTVVSGHADISGNRLKISIPGSNVNGELTDIELKVYDIQGIEGIPIEGMSKKEAKGDVQDEAINQVGQNLPGASGGVIGGVINVVRNIGGRARSEQRIAIPAGYKIILKYGGN